MSTFGIELKNDGNKIITRGDFPTYHYWGSKRITTTSGPLVQQHSIFNLPIETRPIIFRGYQTKFVNLSTGQNEGYPIVLDRGLSTERIIWETTYESYGNWTFDVLVFVPAEFIPPAASSEYGLELYNPAGDIMFNSSRPFLKASGIITQEALTATVVGTVPANAANSVIRGWNSSGDSRSYVYHKDVLSYDYQHINISGTPTNEIMHSAIVDVDFYRQFPNLNDWDTY